MSTFVQNRPFSLDLVLFYALALVGCFFFQRFYVQVLPATIGNLDVQVAVINQTLALILASKRCLDLSNMPLFNQTLTLMLGGGKRCFDLPKIAQKGTGISWFWHLLALGFYGLLASSLFTQKVFFSNLSQPLFVWVGLILFGMELCLELIQSRRVN